MPEVPSFRSSRTRNDAPQVSTPVADRDQPVSRINQLLLIAWTIPSSFVALREEGDRRFSRSRFYRNDSAH